MNIANLIPAALRSSVWYVNRSGGAATHVLRHFASEPSIEGNLKKETIDQIRSRIFGNRIGNNLRSGAKVLRKKLVGEKIANYYLRPIEKEDPLHVDLRAERMTGKLEKLKRRGKAPPKKGQGKRASKKK